MVLMWLPCIQQEVKNVIPVLFQVSTTEPPSSPPVSVTLTVAPPPDGAAVYSPPPPYEPSEEQDNSPGKETAIFLISALLNSFTPCRFTCCNFHM